VILVRVPGTLRYRDVALRSVSAACKLVGGEGKRLEAARRQLHEEMLSAAGEAFNNVAIHGYRGLPVGNIEFQIETDGREIVLRLMDHGRSFDAASAPMPVLDELPEGGFGLYIIKSFVDSIAYEAGQQGKPNVLTLRKRLKSPGKSGSHAVPSLHMPDDDRVEETPIEGRQMIYSRTDTEVATLLKIEGALDAHTVAELRPALETLVADNPRRVIVDLSALRLIDSSGVGAIVSLYKRVRAGGGQVSVTGMRDQPLAIFKLMRLDKALTG
jgi:serine/threonine-protein kinase RsbW